MTAQIGTRSPELVVAETEELSKAALDAGSLFQVTGPLGVTLRYGRLIAFPEILREQVLMMPVLRYAQLGYIDPFKIDQLEHFGNYDLARRQDIHVQVFDPNNEGIYNVNFVRVVPLPTEELFDLSKANGGQAQTFIRNNRRKIAEPSRLVGIDYRGYVREHRQNGFDPTQVYSVAKSMLALGIYHATRSMGIQTWLFNYVPSQAGDFVKSLTGEELVPLDIAPVRPEAYDGPFAPYFNKHKDKEPVFVTLSKAVPLAQAMGAKAKQDLAKYDTK